MCAAEYHATVCGFASVWGGAPVQETRGGWGEHGAPVQGRCFVLCSEAISRLRAELHLLPLQSAIWG
jgi:hypothetical protein